MTFDFLTFFLVTLILGGAAAFMTGRAMALGWKPVYQLVLYSLLLAFAVRFIHFSLFEGTLVSLPFYALDALCLIAIALLAYRSTRAWQMASQYPWEYERRHVFFWQRKNAA